MIDTIKGTVRAIRAKTVALEVLGSGISFAIQVPQEAAYTIGKETTLFAYLHWNQEQGPAFYGFSSELERTVFTLIISCSGIGPKIALASIECLGASGALEAIAQENVSTLSKVPGIGRKKAEQIIVHLKDKVSDLITNGSITVADESNAKQWQQITQVLTSLNYTRQEITAALQHINTTTISNAPFDQQLRTALSYLAKVR